MDLQISGRRVGAYIIVQVLAQRGVAVLCEAVHVGLGHRATVKLIGRVAPGEPTYDRYQRRLFREATALVGTRHGGLPRVIDFGVLDDGVAYLLTEHQGGVWLGERLARGDELSPALAVAVLGQLAEALAALPEHFDLNPEDAVLSEDAAAPGGWRASLVDLGSVPLLSGARLPAPPTGSLLPGESTYLAPELCCGGTPDEATAVYALGVLAYRLLAGAPPFSGGAFDLRGQHLHAAPVPLGSQRPALPEALSALVQEMLAKEPAQRPTLRAVAARLAALPLEALRPAEAQGGAAAPRPIFLPPAGLLAREIPQEYERLRRAMQILRQILEETVEEQRLRRLLDGAGALVLADRGAVVRLGGGEAAVTCARRFGKPDAIRELARAPAAVLAALRGSGPPGHGAVLSADATTDDRFGLDHEIIMDGVRSVLALPLRRGDDLVGALYLDSQDEPGRFTVMDRELLALLCDAAMRR